MKINCPIHYNVNRQITAICLSKECNEKILCDLCREQHSNHTLISLNNIQTNQPIQIPQFKEVIKFISTNHTINLYEIEDHVHFVISQFIQELSYKLKEAEKYLIAKLKKCALQAKRNIDYLTSQINKLFNFEDVWTALNKFQEGTYSKQVVEEIIKNHSNKINGNTEIENIYNYMTFNGANYNYLDIIQLDMCKFHHFKGRILSHFAKLEDFDQFLPKNYDEIPLKNEPTFSWNLINPYNQVHKISQLTRNTKINKLNVQNNIITCVINENKVNQYVKNGRFLRCIHQCAENDFYISTHFHHQVIFLTFWSQPQHINIFHHNKKVKIIKFASANPISKILIIKKYNLYKRGEESILTLDSSGQMKINHLYQNYLHDIYYGQGLVDIELLPDTKNALKQSLTFDSESMFDLIVCSYSQKKIRLQVRSLFQQLPLSKIRDDESIEQRLGLINQGQIYFKVFQLSDIEKEFLQNKMNISQIDYCIVTLQNNILCYWNWKNGQCMRNIDASESLGLRIMSICNNNGLIHLAILIGLEGRIYYVDWLKNQVSNSKFRIGSNLQEIHQMSECFDLDQRHKAFLIVLRGQSYPFLIISQLTYY